MNGDPLAGTEGSNPSPSSGEFANFRFLICRLRRVWCSILNGNPADRKGGVYMCASERAEKDLSAARARVLSIDYLLAPEYPFPAALDDAVTADRWLLAEGAGPRRVAVIGGDTSLKRVPASAKSSTVCGTALLSVISKMSVSHCNRPPGCSVIQRLERSTTPSNGGPGHHPAEREICQPFLRPPHRDLTPHRSPKVCGRMR